MNVVSSTTPERLRVGATERHERVRPVDAEVNVRPKFGWLVLAAVAAIVVQSTLLRPLEIRGAHISLVTILLVWTGLRYGVVTGGWLGFVAGLIEDGLGSAGSNVLGATLAGFFAGLLNVRFFADSLPVFLSAVAGATLLRGVATYLVLELGFGERGMFHAYSHQLLWQVLLNDLVAGAFLISMRALANARR